MQPVQKEAVWPGVIEEDSMWAYADQGSYKMALRKAYKNHDEMLEVAKEAQELVNSKFKNEVLYEKFVKEIYGEQIDLDSWMEELEGDLVEQD